MPAPALGSVLGNCWVGQLLRRAGPVCCAELGRLVVEASGPLAPARARPALGRACPAWATVAAGPRELGRFGPKGPFFFLWYFVNVSNRLNV